MAFPLEVLWNPNRAFEDMLQGKISLLVLLTLLIIVDGLSGIAMFEVFHKEFVKLVVENPMVTEDMQISFLSTTLIFSAVMPSLGLAFITVLMLLFIISVRC